MEILKQPRVIEEAPARMAFTDPWLTATTAASSAMQPIADGARVRADGSAGRVTMLDGISQRDGPPGRARLRGMDAPPIQPTPMTG